MSLFDIFRKKEVVHKAATEIKTKEIVPTSQDKIVPTPQIVATIHEDLNGLVWIADGESKNYVSKTESYKNFTVNGVSFTVSLMGNDEPSLIYTTVEIAAPVDEREIEIPPYFPTYSGLTPEQKWIYLKLLSNPYDTNIDIGFIFILYYGLERHLLEGDFESAFRVILKLRDVHQNKSFQSYSANALVLASMLHQRCDLALEFIASLDKDYKFVFSDNLFLICYFSFAIPLQPSDIMRMAKTFELTKTNYVKNYPEIFKENLCLVMQTEIGSTDLDINRFISKTEIKKIRTEELKIFANTSILDKTISVPVISESFKLKKAINNLLELAHEKTKESLASMRKSGQDMKGQRVNKKAEGTKTKKPKAASNPDSSEVIAQHTEEMRGYSQSRYTSFRQSSLATHWRFLAIPDDRCCEICMSRNGCIWDIDDKENIPPCHEGCRCTAGILLPKINPRHKEMIEDPSMQPQNRNLVPLPDGWSNGIEKR
ncbi:TerB N-terminal domain-containing protein [Pseudanabaena sp. FACHB-1277]|uniref:TerB N-terminal domain-containing protein n=1 Tax=Pseudanabaena cinerea FACHB-1277 TaxID=2949581 RepID=A0A926URJ1_9CYAN|nr:TerB N-terminal domain-containing protein [Pseudanabaena cinerea]MBD2149804.1 TerB N-terminal domain-containing protein [Pseudanabaena cinerea FACHB-1277]